MEIKKIQITFLSELRGLVVIGVIKQQEKKLLKVSR